MISAKVIADSKNEYNNRITTMLVTMPRYILAEFNTHRMFSRNSASSRAIPFEKMVEAVERTPFIPFAWQKDHKGMQGTEYFEKGTMIVALEHRWTEAAYAATKNAKILFEAGVTKQICNRLLEPFMYHTCIVTATEWENFFELRCPQYVMQYTHNGEVRSEQVYRSKYDFLKDNDISATSAQSIDWFKQNKGQAEIHMMALAEAMWDAYNQSTPKQLKAGEWHIPFGDQMEIEQLPGVNIIGFNAEHFKRAFQSNYENGVNFLARDNYYKVRIATACCAQVSYTVIGEDGKEMDYVKLIALHDRLARAGHWSPFEHCAQAMSEDERQENVSGRGRSLGWPNEEGGTNFDDNESALGWSGNFRGFIQYRKTFQGENKTI